MQLTSSKGIQVASTTALLAGAALLGAACMAEPAEPIDVENVGEAAGITWEEFITDYAYQEPDSGIWIADGDTTFLNIDELRRFYDEAVRDGALAVYRTGG